MTPWAWYWRDPEDEAYGDEQPTREAVIEAARRDSCAGDVIEIVEARMSEDRRHEEADVIPFLRTRNKETVVLNATTANAVGTSAASALNKGLRP